jgi:hypothetical protein
MRAVCQETSRARSKNSASFGFDPGHPPAMKETPRLVVAREGDAFALRTVPEGGVVDLDHAVPE